MGTRITEAKRTVCGWPVRQERPLSQQLLEEAPEVWVRFSEGRISVEQAKAELEKRRST